MTKLISVDPHKVRESGVIKTPDIPVNQYRANAQAEVKRYGRERLLLVLRDMAVVREFELMLDSIKKQGGYKDIKYSYGGPAHLSAGQEATVVGQALGLKAEDFIFGSHRSHGEILAKCLAAVAELDEARLTEVMKSYMKGAQLRVVETAPHQGVKDLAADFVIYGTLAEIFAKVTGFNLGMGGSMHAFFAPFGSMPNNAIVGGSADIAVGAALFKRINRRPGIVCANIGDGSSGCGPVWEGIMLSAMDQYRKLWDPKVGGAPPIIFSFFNNFYGMGGQPEGETMGFGQLARLGAGVNPEAMHAERVDGYNPLAVADAITRKREIALAGRGPILLDVVTYRFTGHSPSDAMSYRTKEDLQHWQEHDALLEFGNYLVECKIATKEEVDAIRQQAAARVHLACRLAADMKLSPLLAMTGDPIGAMMFSNQKVEKFDTREPEVLLPKADNPRVKSNAGKARYAIGPDGKPLPKNKVLALRDALFEAMLHRFYIDPTMIAYGEENRDWGGAFAVYRGLTEALPYHRLFNSPISEGAIAGSAAGYAMCGGRVVPELMYCDFLGRAGDEVFNQIAKWQAMSANILKMPLVLRISVGSKYGAQHSQDWTSMCAHVPGLKVYFPVTPYDAKGMLNLALAGTDPVIFFESQRVYDIGELFVASGVPESYYEVPEGEPAIRRAGKDVTIVTIGATLYRALEAADLLAAKYQVSAEVIDARFINPLNLEKILESVKKTGKLVLASDACERGSFLHTIATTVTQLAFDDLDGPAVVVGARNWITPPTELEDHFFPGKEWIVDAIHERLLPLPGHEVKTVQTNGEILRRYQLGI